LNKKFSCRKLIAQLQRFSAVAAEILSKVSQGHIHNSTDG